MSDTCDTKLTKANLPKPNGSDRQRRFLDAYRQRVSIAPAARLAGVHRATVYRWQADPAFVAAMQAAADAFFAEHRAKVRAAEAARQERREQRERERRPMRLEVLARGARAGLQ